VPSVIQENYPRSRRQPALNCFCPAFLPVGSPILLLIDFCGGGFRCRFPGASTVPPDCDAWLIGPSVSHSTLWQSASRVCVYGTRQSKLSERLLRGGCGAVLVLQEAGGVLDLSHVLATLVGFQRPVGLGMRVSKRSEPLRA
jgi:hypothetical protein